MANDESKEGANNAGLTVDGLPVSENLSEAEIGSGARIDGSDSLPEQRRKDLETFNKGTVQALAELSDWTSELMVKQSIDYAVKHSEKCSELHL